MQKLAPNPLKPIRPSKLTRPKPLHEISGLTGLWARALVVMGGLLLLIPGMVMLAGMSHRFLRLETYPIGVGVDRFYTLPPEIEPIGEIVRLIGEELQQTPPDQTVLVLPEGEMINYLAKRASPVAPFFFFSAATSGGREES